MRLVTFQSTGKAPEPGLVVDQKVVSLAPLFPDMVSLIAAGAPGLNKIQDYAKTAASVDVASVKLLAPIPRPSKLICIGLNYRDHAIESGMEIPKVPTVF